MPCQTLIPQPNRSGVLNPFYPKTLIYKPDPLPSTFKSRNQTGGTKRDGSIFMVLQSLIFRIDRPEAAIRTPPTIEISAISGSDKKPDSTLAPR